MVKRYGLSPKFRNMVFGNDNDEVFVGASFGQVQSYSDATAFEIDKEIQRIIDECYEKTKDVLMEHKNVVEGLSARLMAVNKVDGPEFEEIFEKDGDLTDILEREKAAKEAEEKAKAEEEAKKAEEAKPASEEKPEEAKPAPSEQPSEKPAEEKTEGPSKEEEASELPEEGKE